VAAPDRGLNTWTHVAGVYDDDASLLRVYVNGVLEAIKPITTVWEASGAVTVGRSKWNSNMTNYWRGNIDDFHAYNHALGSEDIVQL
jgi:Concanavalin A-like lectin/glucanases superfamily